MDAWRRRFSRRVLLATLASQAPITLTLALLATRRWGVSAPLVAAVAALGVMVVNVPLMLRLRDWRDHQRRSLARVWLVELPYFALFAAGFFFAITCAPVALIALVVARSTRAALDALAWLSLGSLCAGLYAVFVRRLWTPVATVEIAIPQLDPSLDGVTIAQLSDVHCGPYMPRWFLRRLARRASSLGADLCVVTGDSITEGEGYLDDVSELARHLRAPCGTFAILGNHDYFGTTDGVRLAFERAGVRVLRNEGVTLSPRERARMYLAGVDDNWTGRDDLERALSDRPARASCVLLAHDPTLFDGYTARAEVDLVLSGHTHAGQIGVPFVTHRFNLGRVKFSRSLGVSRSRDGRATLFVHPGNGTSGPPVRFGVAPVIAKIVLRAGCTTAHRARGER